MNRRTIFAVDAERQLLPSTVGLITMTLACGCASVRPSPPINNAAASSNRIPFDASSRPGWEEWFFERSEPRGDINWDGYGDADRQTAQMMGWKNPPGPIGDKWKFMGPTDLDTSGQYGLYGEGEPPLGGRTNAVAWDPTNPAIMYAASACGGVWKSTDGGGSWKPLTDNWTELYTSAIAVNPDDPNHIIVGTGDFPESRGRGFGLKISHNGGATWQTEGHMGRLYSDVVFDPDYPDIIVASTGRSDDSTLLYRSDDGGGSFNWTLNINADWCDLAISAPFYDNAPRRYYYAIGVEEDYSDYVFYRSDDRGQTWQPKTLPIQSNSELKAMSVTNSPWYYRHVYVYSASTKEVFFSDDAGDTWADITGDLDMDPDHWTQSFYSFRIHCFNHTGRGGHVYDALLLGNNDLLLSPYANGQWVSLGGPTYSENARIHVDVHAFATDPSEPNRHLITTDGGIYGWEFDSDTFYPLNRHYGTHLVNTIAVHPTDIETMIGGTQDNGMPASRSDLDHWDNIMFGDTGYAAISQTWPDIQFAAVASSLGRDQDNRVYIHVTDNAWDDYNVLSTTLLGDSEDEPMRHGTPLRLDEDNPHLLYFATNYLYRYNGITHLWDKRVGNQKLSSGSYVSTFEIAPSNGNYIYTGSKDGELWMTTDAGQNWERIDDGSLPDTTFADICVDPLNPRSILVCFRGTWTEDKLWECKNTTANHRVWTVVEGSGQGELAGYPINAIARHPSSPKTHWFVGTDNGTYGTTNGGQSWLNMTVPLGLPRVHVTDLATVRSIQGEHYLFASTYGRGFWRLRLNKMPSTYRSHSRRDPIQP